MNRTLKRYSPTLIILGLVIILGIIQAVKNRDSSDNQPNEASDSQSNTPSGNNRENDTPVPSGEQKLQGSLKISDDLRRGNLMLVTSERAIYLFTSRDYSSLLDKQVTVEIEGTLENFRLVDIKAK